MPVGFEIYGLTHICLAVYKELMNLVRIHECLCDPTRLRIVHLLLGGPLCVCHLQEVLGEPQVKVSRHLSYLRRRGMVTVERCGQWMIYRLPEKRTALLESNLACLQDCSRDEPVLRNDIARLARLKARLGDECPACVREPSVPRARRSAAVRRKS